MNLALSGSVALVTAGSSGLGRASATALAREGADVAICARNAERLEAARAAIEAAGDGDVLAVQTDVTDPDGIDALVDEVASDFGGLDHLVASAGVPPGKPFVEATERDWYTTYDLLVMSVVRLADRCRPLLVESDTGSLLAVGSTDARRPMPDNVPANAVRRSVLGLVETLALEWAPAVRANAVLAGPHRTPALDTRVEAGVDRGRYDTREEGYDDLLSEVPLDRVGDPDRFGELVAFLSSDRAAFVTGAAVPVDGGLLGG